MKKIYFAGLILSVIISCKNESPKAGTETPVPEEDTAVIRKTESPVTENKTPDKAEIPVLKECTEKQADYETIQECTFSNTKMEDVYRRTLKEKDIENTELLLPGLPEQTMTKDINQNGLISIHYTVKAGKIEIVLAFEGGVTTLELEQKGENVKRTIVHSAD